MNCIALIPRLRYTLCEVFALKLFYSDIENIISPLEGGAKVRARSSLVRLLLKAALEDVYGLSFLPDISVKPGGKPFFASLPDVHFSLSHSDGFIMCAVSDSPVGCDIQTVRNVSEKLIRRIMGNGEAKRFEERGRRTEDFFRLWTLKESALKLYGDPGADFTALCFELDPPASETGNMLCAVYESIPDCFAAVCSEADAPPENLTEIDSRLL